MRILAACGQDPILIRSRFFYHFSRLFIFFNDNTFQIRYKLNIMYYKPVVIGCGSGTMTALLDNNNTRFANQNNGLCIYHLFLND